MQNVCQMSASKEVYDAVNFAYGYCHGLFSHNNSVKGNIIKSFLNEFTDIELLNLNLPDDSGVFDYGAGLDTIHSYYLNCQKKNENIQLRLIGSSLGGYLIARYAELHPEHVDRIFMLCPSFCVSERSSVLFSLEEIIQWEKNGFKEIQRGDGFVVKMPWAFIENSKLQPNYPSYQCPAMVIHGTFDEIVPIEIIQNLMATEISLKQVTNVIIVEDKHALDNAPTLSVLQSSLRSFFDFDRFGQNRALIEVEKKFSINDVEDLERKILAEGGEKIMENVFTDTYWDNSLHILASKDYWLRCRAGLWQLKTPVADRTGDNNTAAYREFTSLFEIVHELKLIDPGMSEQFLQLKNFQNDLERFGFEPFVDFQTRRCKYKLDRIVIDIDRASFGHTLVELETMCENEQDVKNVEQKLTELAIKLGLSCKGQGKVEEYLRRFCPEKLRVVIKSWNLSEKDKR